MWDMRCGAERLCSWLLPPNIPWNEFPKSDKPEQSNRSTPHFVPHNYSRYGHVLFTFDNHFMATLLCFVHARHSKNKKIEYKYIECGGWS